MKLTSTVIPQKSRMKILILILHFFTTSSNFWDLRTTEEVPGSVVERHAVVDRTALPKLSDTDMIELYHLRSFPRLAIMTQAGSFSVQTSGIALRSTDTNQKIVLMFEPTNYSACFLPVIGPNATLLWDKRAKISYMNQIDSSYWQQSTFLARINGVVYANFVKWIEIYLREHPFFIPESICSGSDTLSCFTMAQTWDTFLSDSLQAFAHLAVQMHAILPPRASEIQVLSGSEPQRLYVVEDPVSPTTVEYDAAPSATNDDALDPNFNFSPKYEDGASSPGPRGSSSGKDEEPIGDSESQRPLLVATTNGQEPPVEQLSSTSSFDMPRFLRSHSQRGWSNSTMTNKGEDDDSAEEEKIHTVVANIVDTNKTSANSTIDATPEMRHSQSRGNGTKTGSGARGGAKPSDTSGGTDNGSSDEEDDGNLLDSTTVVDVVPAAPTDMGSDVVVPVPAAAPSSPTSSSDATGTDSSSSTSSDDGKDSAKTPEDGAGVALGLTSAPTEAPTVTFAPSLRNASRPVDPNATVWTAELPPVEVPLTEETRNTTNADVVQYFVELMACMQAYQLESFSSALRSCMTEETAYLHRQGVTVVEADSGEYASGSTYGIATSIRAVSGGVGVVGEREYLSGEQRSWRTEEGNSLAEDQEEEDEIQALVGHMKAIGRSKPKGLGVPKVTVISDSHYVCIHPRYPFVYVHDYLQPIPTAVLTTDEGTGMVDILIGGILLFAAIAGCLASLWKLKLCEWCWVKTRTIRRRRLSLSAPLEGGYSKSSELPVYRMWGGMWGSPEGAEDDSALSPLKGVNSRSFDDEGFADDCDGDDDGLLSPSSSTSSFLEFSATEPVAVMLRDTGTPEYKSGLGRRVGPRRGSRGSRGIELSVVDVGDGDDDGGEGDSADDVEADAGAGLHPPSSYIDDLAQQKTGLGLAARVWSRTSPSASSADGNSKESFERDRDRDRERDRGFQSKGAATGSANSSHGGILRSRSGSRSGGSSKDELDDAPPGPSDEQPVYLSVINLSYYDEVDRGYPSRPKLGRGEKTSATSERAGGSAGAVGAGGGISYVGETAFSGRQREAGVTFGGCNSDQFTGFKEGAGGAVSRLGMPGHDNTASSANTSAVTSSDAGASAPLSAAGGSSGIGAAGVAAGGSSSSSSSSSSNSSSSNRRPGDARVQAQSAPGPTRIPTTYKPISAYD